MLRVRRQLLDAVDSLPEDLLNVPASWTHGESVARRIAGETYLHREEHIAALQDRLKVRELSNQEQPA